MPNKKLYFSFLIIILINVFSSNLGYCQDSAEKARQEKRQKYQQNLKNQKIETVTPVPTPTQQQIDEVLRELSKPGSNGEVVKKPAIYLYPENPENINIKLSPEIKLTIDIPKYHPEKGWNVKAYPSGKVEDLQPEYTNCNEIDSKTFGLEYAKSACEQNNYPYLYWDGFTPMPDKAEGWLVKRDEVESFLEEKLVYVGFNKVEKKEFLEYWVHKITAQKQDQYFIYFVQGEEVDKYIPMTVTPQPDSFNRFYIVVDLDVRKRLSPEPQQLQKFVRKAFTLVEWGGTIKSIKEE